MENITAIQSLLIALWVGAVMSRAFLGGRTQCPFGRVVNPKPPCGHP